MSDTPSDNFVPTPPSTESPVSPQTPIATGATAVSSTSGMAIAGLVCAFLIPLLGLIFSIIGLNQTKDNKRGGRGLALAGLIISILGILAGLFWLVIFILAAASTPDTPNYNYDYNSSSSSISSDNTTVKTGAIGEAVEAENIELTVAEVKRGYTPESDFYTPEDGKEYVAVSVSLKNVGTDTENFSSFDFKMRDGTGTEKSDAFVGGTTGELSSGSLAGGGTTSGIMVFEVPVGDNSLVLIYEPSIFAEEKVEISL